MKCPLLVLAGTAALLLLAGAGARAGTVTYNTCGPFVDPIPGCNLPWPCQVPGKEYSNYADKDMFGVQVPEQALKWDGQGGVANTFNYGGSGEVDALANCQDALYHAVINDQASLLWSTGTPNTCPPCMDPNIYYEKPGPCACTTRGLWAAANTVNASTHGDPPVLDINDVDGLEVWGPEGSDDANRYSLAGDPADATGKVAVWAYTPASGGIPASSSAWLYDATILTALNDPDGLNLGLPSNIDLDAMMTYDEILNDGEFGDAGDSIMFSLAPVCILNGGEIFVLDALGGGQFTARYLDHGCHLWDTTWASNNLPGYAGSLCQNVNALEAVSTPEPVTLIGLMMGAGSLAGYMRRRRRR